MTACTYIKGLFILKGWISSLGAVAL